jgi:hypothetical protein
MTAGAADVAPVLQCPECGTKHPLADIPDGGTFRCDGCGRTLKVPSEVRRAPASVAPGSAATAAAPVAQPVPAADDIAATRAVPRSQPAAIPLQQTTRSVPRWARFLLWIVAVPLGFMIVFGFARATGVFTGTQLEDIFLATGWHRFWPLVRVLPFVALVIAGIVQGGVVLLMRRGQPRGSGRGGLATGTSEVAATSARFGGRNSHRTSAATSSSARRGDAARSTGA